MTRANPSSESGTTVPVLRRSTFRGHRGEAVYDIDSTGAQTLLEMLNALDELGIGFAMARVRTELRDEFLTVGLDERLAGDSIYLEVDDAVAAYLRRTGGTLSTD